MNPLLQATRVDIIEREAFSNSCIFDKNILIAIDAYDIEGSVKRRAHAFINALSPLGSLYQEKIYEPLFKSFIDMEIGLEALSEDHSSHVNHVIQEFLFGYNIITNCDFLKKEYHFKEGRNKPDSDFGRLFFSWMAASLFHDVGYDIERAFEEEAFRENKNEFWNFMTQRATTQGSLTFTPQGPGSKIIENYILKDINQIPDAPEFTYAEFEKLFLRSVPNRKNWYRFDHGLISAVKYLVELEKLQTEKDGDYLNWGPNRNAALAMALHNFRYKENCDLRLTCSNQKTLIPYLLIVSDEVQEWERERGDIDAILPCPTISGGQTTKRTDLMGITFRDKRAYVILDHKLKDSSLKGNFEKYLDKKILMQKKHYPIKVFFPQLRTRLRKEIRDKIIKKSTTNIASATLPFWPFSSLIEIKPDTLNTLKELSVKVGCLRRMQKIANAECEKDLLIPTAPNSIYQVYIDHRIDGAPYLTVAFPL